MCEFRIGQGFDAHRFVKDKPLILGGIKIPFKLGLSGHSDADVLTHAIIDSILGALCLDDIGHWFPDNSSKYKNIDSLLLLKEVIESEKLSGWSIINVDSTIIAQEPKLSPYIEKMRISLSETIRISPDRISIKGKTTEKMGFCGRKEGIACLVNSLLIKKN